ncbi:MAG: PadR family transcriptional regulator [Phycisphaerae bacterium]
MPEQSKAKNRYGGRTLSELESIALVTVHRLEPCTPYAVRCTFREAHAAWFSSSAGSIYPLLRRLERGGFLRAAPDKADKRKRKFISTTAQGRTMAREWLCAASPDQVDTFDPLRTRGRFLALLPAAQREAWVYSQRLGLKAQRKRIEEALRAGDDSDEFAQLAHAHALLENDGRLRWLDQVELLLKTNRLT